MYKLCRLRIGWLLYFLFLFCLYFYFHNPTIGGIGSLRCLYLPTLIVLYKNQIWFRLFYKTFKLELLFLFLLSFYVLIRTIIGGDPIMLRIYFYAIMEIFFMPAFLLFFAFKIRINGENIFIETLLRIGAIATFITLICILFPSVNEFVKNNLLTLEYDSYLYNNEFRGFGISTSLTSDYGYIQGVMIFLTLIYAKINRFYILILPLVFISALLNARTGCIIAFVGFLLFLMQKRISLTTIFLTTIILLIGINIEYILIFFNFSTDTIKWIGDFWEEIIAIADGDVEGTTAGVLMGRMFILPNTIYDWIIGRGYSLFGMDEVLGMSSDVGFVNQLSYGGLIYIILLYCFFGYTCKRLFLSKRKSFTCFYIMVFFIVNMKSSYLINCGTFRLMLLIYYFYILSFSDKSYIKNYLK